MTAEAQVLRANADAAGEHPSWSSRFAFLMASVGFAVGLGNIWKFPYVTGENGGGAFVIVYLLCAFGIGVPILIAEIMIGRCGRKSPPGSVHAVALAEGRSRHWRTVGRINIVSVFVIAVFYCVVVGWVLNYLFRSLLTGFAGSTTASAASAFDSMLLNTPALVFWTVVGLALAGTIIYSGVRNGIERAVTILMPALFVLLVVLVVYNMFAGGMSEAIAFLFKPDFSKVNGAVVLAAIGQAFFSIGIASATMMTFGSYLPRSVSIPRSAAAITLLDTLVAVIAGLVVFPIVFRSGLDPGSGSGLIFESLPVAFAEMSGGHAVSVLFFLILGVAAITSLVGSVEALTHWFEERAAVSRHASTVLVLTTLTLCSVVSALGYNALESYRAFGRNINEALIYATDNLLLPLGGLLIALFAGWFIKPATLKSELGFRHARAFSIWYFLIRYVAPAGVFAVLVFGLTA